MSNPVRNLPPITTLQHQSMTPHQTEQIQHRLGEEPNPSSEPHILHHSHSEGSEDQDRNPVHPNAKTTSTTNAANGSTTTKTNISSPVCRNCKTQTTPLWRRDESGQVLCNACGLFLKLHGRPRPISLKTDVIKSRNRVRHTPSGSSKASASNPNTPELKARENNNGQQKQKFSPKQYKPSKSNKNSPALTAVNDGQSLRSPSLVPLLPRGDQVVSGNQYQYSNWSTHLHPQQHRQTQQQSYLKQHQHFAQPLHYPSSAPTQFAPNLTTITSPLLLATTTSTPKFNPSQSSERGSLNSKQNDKELAAVALENLSNDHDDKRISQVKLEDGISLNGNKPYSPSSALNSNNSPSMVAQVGTKLPELVAAAASGQQHQEQHEQLKQTGSASPSFGPQFSLSHQHAPHQHSNLSNSSSIPSIRYDDNDSKETPPLPSLKPLLSDSPRGLPSLQTPHQSLLNPINHYASPQEQIHHHSQSLPPIQQQLAQGSSDVEPGSNGQRLSSQSSIDSSNHTKSNTDDPNVLKTRISELELVNDLYRTRIMELELMESAARQRETLLKNRLEELKMLPNVSNLSNNSSIDDNANRKRPKYES